MSIQRVIRVATAAFACVAGLWQLALQTRLYVSRVGYPWDIEWLEGTWLYEAYRMIHGLSLYGPLTNGYIAPNHPPGYPIVLAIFGRLFGLDYATGRTVSFVCFLAAAGLVIRALVRGRRFEVQAWTLAVAAVGCSAAGASVCDGFYDLVREDAMAVFLCVLAACLVDTRSRLSSRRIAAVSLVLTALIFTRVPGVFLGAWIVVFATIRHRRSGLLIALGTIAACGLALVALEFKSRGYYWQLTISLVQDQRVNRQTMKQGLWLVTRFAPFLLALPVVVGALALRRRASSSMVLWVGLFAASLPTSLLPYGKVGGSFNDLMPAVFFVGPAAAFVVRDLLDWVQPRERLALLLQSGLFVGFGVFLFARTYDLGRFAPSDATRRHALALNRRIAKLHDGVVAPCFPFVPIRTGHDTLQWADMSYLDMEWSGTRSLDLGDYVDHTHAKWVLVSGRETALTARELARRYVATEPIEHAPATMVGLKHQVKYLLGRREPTPHARVVFDFVSNLDGWTQEGDAFRLTTDKPAGQPPVAGAVGKHLVSSFRKPEGDKAVGKLKSPPFVLDRPHLALRVGGHGDTWVELRVNGVTRRKVSGIFEQPEVLATVVWDVTPWIGQSAELVLVDNDTASRGRLLVDEVTAY